MAPVVIVGAGPAGRAAAARLVEHGVEVTLVDALAEPLAAADASASLHRRCVTAFHAEPGVVWLLGKDGVERLAWSHLVIATGTHPTFAPDPHGATWLEAGHLPENRLAAAIGCDYAFDPVAGWLLPSPGDAPCTTSVDGVFVIGGARGIVSEANAGDDGSRTAALILGGRATDAGEPARPAQGWSWPTPDLPEAFELCPCSRVTVGEAREAIAAGADTTHHLAQFSGAGSGECRGRRCGLAIAHVLAVSTGRELSTVLLPPAEFPAVSVPVDAFAAITPQRPTAAPPARDRGRL